jgi:membrane protein YdbS with pleckstrin-like domain
MAPSVYSGLRAGLARWLRVPWDPPTLPVRQGERLVSFRPSPRFLAYLKLWFWIALLVIDGLLTTSWITILIVEPVVGAALFPVYVVVAFVPDIFVYLALQLRYDSTWYVMTDRSLRIRRGIWIIREATITHENVQNVRITQGPIQRRYGIATVIVETAGGGSMGPHGKSAGAHVGILEGLDNAHEVRDQIMARVRASRSAGLGDDRRDAVPRAAWSREHLRALREIRDLLPAASG